MADSLQNNIQYLKGVGEKRAARLNKLGVYTVADLLYLYPRRYVDYSAPLTVARAPFDESRAVKATVLQKMPGVRVKGGRTIFKIFCADDTAGLEVVFFNSEYIAARLEVGKEYIFYGKAGGNMLTRQMISPTFVSADSPHKRVPVYPLTAGLSSAVVSGLVANAFASVKDIPDYMPREILEKYRLPSLYRALKNIHFPSDGRALKSAAERLSFDELFILQLGLMLLNRQKKTVSEVKVTSVNIDDFLSSMPFNPTAAQFGAIKDILLDFKSGRVMNRLVQGDVGSGKTLVAVCAMYCMYKNGYQSCIMAPTEILAVQHRNNISRMLSPFGVRVGLLTASLKAGRRKNVLSALENGEIDILVGTHSVLGDRVSFSRLGLFVTDEQHRFGVNQRTAAAKKGENPHILVMSATPIPRTLAMIIYAGMDISVINQMPAGRQPVKTFLVGTDKRRRMFAFIQKNIDLGRQCYIVLPAIDENENATDIQSVKKYCEETVKPLLPTARVGLLHGKMKAAEKQQVMEDFSRGKIDVLCSTTVIEVGLDVPNAVLMIIENAERYGLSALHQLRGRVGRGARQSWCILVSDKKNPNVRSRLAFLAANPDGFAVSQYDLEQRGPGDFFGSRQHGLPVMKAAHLCSDLALAQKAKDAAAEILGRCPDLSRWPQLREKTEKRFSALIL